MTILHITQNGITDHIGRSQIAPYVMALAELGFSLHVLSAEKAGREPLIDRYEVMFRKAGVKWTRVPYRIWPPTLGQSWTQLQQAQAARDILKSGCIDLIHCRSFPAAIIGYQLKRHFNAPYIFDFRDFYADTGLETSRRPVRRMLYRYFKQMEGPMIRNADRIICLTDRARELLTEWYLRDSLNADKRFMVIPCCADFSHFDRARITTATREAAMAKARLSGDEFVLLYLGSLGPDYLLDKMIALFRQVQAIRPGARFLFVCNNGRELVDEECRRQGVDPGAIRFVTADRDDVPAMISLADLSVLFYRQGLRSTGCSPTKLAELFAMNVPVIANSGVGDLDRLLDIKRNGSITVSDFSDEGLRNAVEKVVRARAEQGLDIRAASAAFDLAEGVRRYAAVYQDILGEISREAAGDRCSMSLS